jgi:phosphatidylglycerol:prolipoprotein diacylglycerol transferase
MDQIPTYYLVISTVVCLCLLWIRQRAVAREFKHRLVLDLSLLGLASGFIGARLMHVLYEYPQLYIQEPWRIFDIGRGGYVYYGGLLTGLGTAWIFLKFKKVSDIGAYFDLFAPVLSFGYAAGRIACLLSGCCYGPVTSLPWGLGVLDENGAFQIRQPTPLYATLIESGVLIFILWAEKRRVTQAGSSRNALMHLSSDSGGLFFLWLFLHSTARFFLEFLRDDFRGPHYLFSISGWISSGLIAISLYYLLVRRPSAQSH